MEHRHERPGVPAAHVLVVERRDVRTRDVARARPPADAALERGESAVGQAHAPASPRVVHQIEMMPRQFQVHVVRDRARAQERCVVRLAVERDQQVVAAHLLRDRREQRGLLAVVAREVLTEHEVLAVPRHGARQEHGTRRESAGLEIQEDRAREPQAAHTRQLELPRRRLGQPTPVRASRLDLAAQPLVHVHRAVLGMVPLAARQIGVEADHRGDVRAALATTRGRRKGCGLVGGRATTTRGRGRWRDRVRVGARLGGARRETRGRHERAGATSSHQLAEAIPQRVAPDRHPRRSATIASRRLAGP